MAAGFFLAALRYLELLLAAFEAGVDTVCELDFVAAGFGGGFGAAGGKSFVRHGHKTPLFQEYFMRSGTREQDSLLRHRTSWQKAGRLDFF
jgi:hypothetical protein